MCEKCNFTHLHNHTVYSKLDGAISAAHLFPRLKGLGMDTFTKTDHGTMAGVLEFAKAADKHDIKLIAGCEFYEVNDIREKFIGESDCREPAEEIKEGLTDERPDLGRQRYWHVTMLAKDREGYRQLVKLSTAANTRDAYFFKPRLDTRILEEIVKPGHIFLGTGCAISRMSRTALVSDDIADLDRDLDYYHRIFGGDNIFVEIMATGYEPQKAINEKLIELGERRGLPIVVTNDCHYLTKEHARLQDVLVCVATGQFVDDTDRKFKFEGSDYYVKTPDELKKAFKEMQGLDVKDEWISNTRLISEQCEHASYAYDPEFKLPIFEVRKESILPEFQEWVERTQDQLKAQLNLSDKDIEDVLNLEQYHPEQKIVEAKQ